MGCYITVQRESLAGESLANWLILNILWKKVWWVNRSANRLLIINANLDGFSLANHERFAEFANIPLPKFPSLRYIKQLWAILQYNEGGSYHSAKWEAILLIFAFWWFSSMQQSANKPWQMCNGHCGHFLTLNQLAEGDDMFTWAICLYQ